MTNAEWRTYLAAELALVRRSIRSAHTIPDIIVAERHSSRVTRFVVAVANEPRGYTSEELAGLYRTADQGSEIDNHLLSCALRKVDQIEARIRLVGERS